jgi:hypothetical protein
MFMTTSDSEQKQIYVIQYVNWDDFLRGSFPVPVELFEDWTSAEQRRIELQRYRVETNPYRDNPFDFLEWQDVTSLPEKELIEHMRMLEVPLPPRLRKRNDTVYNWKSSNWWSKAGDFFDEYTERRYEFWASFNRIPFFEVISIPWQE